MDHPAQMRKLRMELEMIRARYDHEMSAMGQKYQAAEDSYEKEAVAMAEKQRETESRHQRELGNLKNLFRSELSGMKGHFDKEMTAMAEKRRETEDQRQAQLNNLQETHRRQYKDLHDNHEEEKTAISEAHKKESSRYKSEMEAALNTKQYQINTSEARIQKLEQDNVHLERSFADERFQLSNLQTKYYELSAMRKADKQTFDNTMETEILKLEQDKLDLERCLDEEYARRRMWKVKYHELSAMKRADEQQTLDSTAYPIVESETSISPKIDRDGSEVQTENQTQEVTKEEKPTDGQASRLARRLGKEAMKTEKPMVRQPPSLAHRHSKDAIRTRQASSLARRRSKKDMGEETTQVERASLRRPSLRDMREVPAVRQAALASSPRLGQDESVAIEVIKNSKVRYDSRLPPPKPRGKQGTTSKFIRWLLTGQGPMEKRDRVCNSRMPLEGSRMEYKIAEWVARSRAQRGLVNGRSLSAVLFEGPNNARTPDDIREPRPESRLKWLTKGP